MVDEKRDEKKDDKKATEAAASAASMKPVVWVCLGVFLVATAGFAWMEGLFGPAPTPEPLAVQADSTADSSSQAPTASEHAYVSPENETLAQAASRPDRNTLGHESSTAAGADSESLSISGSHDDLEWINNEKRQLTQRRVELDQKQKELEKLKTEIEHLLARVQESKTERIVMMAKLYDSMDPEAVARQISSMDDRTVIMLLPQMNTRTAAKVMAAVDPKRAAQITTKMLALEP